MAPFSTLIILLATVAGAPLDPFKQALTGPDRLIEIKRQAEAGDPKAQKDYGDAMDGAFKFVEAEEWYRKSAASGYSEGLYALGSLYSSGKYAPANRVAANATNAFHLFQLAALQGHKSSHSRLGHIHMSGKIVPRDPVKAYRHFKLAGSADDHTLKRLILEMTQTQIEDAQAQANAFKPVPFKAAFETLALDSLRLETITGPGNQRFAIINGKPCNPSNPLRTSFAGLPATFICTALDQTTITLTIGASSRTLRTPSRPR